MKKIFIDVDNFETISVYEIDDGERVQKVLRNVPYSGEFILYYTDALHDLGIEYEESYE